MLKIMKVTDLGNDEAVELVELNDGNVLFVRKYDGKITYIKDKSLISDYIELKQVKKVNNELFLI